MQPIIDPKSDPKSDPKPNPKPDPVFYVLTPFDESLWDNEDREWEYNNQADVIN